jgi:hypothetical protein
MKGCKQLWPSSWVLQHPAPVPICFLFAECYLPILTRSFFCNCLKRWRKTGESSDQENKQPWLKCVIDTSKRGKSLFSWYCLLLRVLCTYTKTLHSSLGLFKGEQSLAQKQELKGEKKDKQFQKKKNNFQTMSLVSTERNLFSVRKKV